MKKPIMKKEDLDKEYLEVSPDEICSVPLIQTIELLGLRKYELPVIRTPAIGIYETYLWLENEKQKGLFGYNYHIENTKDHLKKDYPEIKIKLNKEFKPKRPGYNPSHKSEEVCQFINSALILEVNHFMNICPSPMIFERTLH